MGWEGFGGGVRGGVGFDEVLKFVGVSDMRCGQHGLRDAAVGSFGAVEADGQGLRAAEVEKD